MKDIPLNSPLMRIWHILSWVFFVILGFPLIWIIALGLYTYGQYTPENKKIKRNLLNLTYQKFIFVYGSITGGIAILMVIISVIFALIGGTINF